jgi:hypothetical protein
MRSTVPTWRGRPKKISLLFSHFNHIIDCIIKLHSTSVKPARMAGRICIAESRSSGTDKF